MNTSKELQNLFDDLQMNAYNSDYHTYYYKDANQIIRKHFERFEKQVKVEPEVKVNFAEVLVDYSKYECPYSHLEKESGHELHAPEEYQDVYGVWCACGFRAPVFYPEPEDLKLRLKPVSSNCT